MVILFGIRLFENNFAQLLKNFSNDISFTKNLYKWLWSFAKYDFKKSRYSHKWRG